MSDKKIAKIALGLPIQDTFDYSVGVALRSKIEVGARVRVVFNRREMLGYVFYLTDHTRIKRLSPIIKLIDEKPIFSKRYLDFICKAADYYCASAGEMIETTIPLSLRSGKPVILRERPEGEKGQRKNKGSIKNSEFNAYVYFANDEAKKRDFFTQKIKEALENNKQVILLLPDTRLINFWLMFLQERFNLSRIVSLHSRLTQKQAFSAWSSIKNQEADIVIGSRSAIFSPLENIGLIIVDYEDNFVYKQETRPYYHARDIAIMLARNFKATLVLSSIAPSIDVYNLVIKDKFELICDRDAKIQDQPKVRIIDLKNQFNSKKREIFSLALLEKIRQNLTAKKKVLLFLNRKGFATYVRCWHCGFVLRCKRCSAGLIYYFHKKDLHCPHCNYQIAQIDKCPECALGLIYFGGLGIERIESEAYRLFPAAKIVFLDSASEELDLSCADLVISSQAGLKEGLIKEGIDLVCIIAIDDILNFAQLRSSEETFRLLLRLRNLTKEEMLIQTFYPEHRVFKNIVNADYVSFAREELADRKTLKLPPINHILSVNLRAADEKRLVKCAQNLFLLLSEQGKNSAFEAFEAIKDSPYQLRSKFRLQILLKTAKVEGMSSIINKAISELKEKYSILITVNVDI